MSGKRIKVIIKKDGNVTFEVNGVEGSSCMDLTNMLIEGLGDKEEQVLKEEYFEERPDYVENFEG